MTFNTSPPLTRTPQGRSITPQLEYNMKRVNSFIGLIMFSVTVVLSLLNTSWAQVPSDFYHVTSTPGAELFRKDYSGGAPDYVLVADLRSIAVESSFGNLASSGIGGGPLGGDNPTFDRQSLSGHWSDATMNFGSPFAAVNGQFFSTASNPTSLAFSVRADDMTVSDGYGITTEYPGQIRLLRINSGLGYAEIVDFTSSRLSDWRFDEAIAGLDVLANKGPYNYTGRTFLGIRDDNVDGLAETLIIFVSSSARQSDAAAVLADFGAHDQLMLDGGGSSQLIVEGTSHVSSSRSLPHALILVATGSSASCHVGANGSRDYCSASCPCDVGEGDCDNDSECASGLTCARNVGSTYGWSSGVDVCESPTSAPGGSTSCHVGANGSWDYCSASCPCDAGEGDCDNDSECAPGLTCAQNVGSTYGWRSSVDVCESPTSAPSGSTSCHVGAHGSWDYCSASCPCDAGEGDCDNDSECAPGLICAQNVGSTYGWGSGVDVCESPTGSPAGSTSCHAGANGSWNYCSASCPCNAGEGDCDNDSECASGLICAQNVGSSYGWRSSVDVCESPTGASGGSGRFTSIGVGSSTSGYVTVGTEDAYSFQMVSGRHYTVTMTPTSGDPDLYIHNESSISTSNWLCRPYLGSMQPETCSFTAPWTGTNYVLVDGYSAAGYSLSVTSP